MCIATSSREGLRRRVDVMVRRELSARDARECSVWYGPVSNHPASARSRRRRFKYGECPRRLSTRCSAALRGLRPSFDAIDPPCPTRALAISKPGAGDGPSVASPPEPTVVPAPGCCCSASPTVRATIGCARVQTAPVCRDAGGFDATEAKSSTRPLHGATDRYFHTKHTPVCMAFCRCGIPRIGGGLAALVSSVGGVGAHRTDPRTHRSRGPARARAASGAWEGGDLQAPCCDCCDMGRMLLCSPRAFSGITYSCI